MFNIFSSFWKKKCTEVETLPPPPKIQLHHIPPAYKVQTDTNVQKNLIRMRRNIKRMGYEIRIDKEERRHMQRAKTPLFSMEEEHNTYLFNVREQRARFIAYGYLKGRRYSQIEDNPHCRKYFRRIKKKIGKQLDGRPIYEKNADGQPVYIVAEFGPDKEEPNWSRVANIIFQHHTPNSHLLSTAELEKKKTEITTKLKVWAGN